MSQLPAFTAARWGAFLYAGLEPDLELYQAWKKGEVALVNGLLTLSLTPLWRGYYGRIPYGAGCFEEEVVKLVGQAFRDWILAGNTDLPGGAEVQSWIDELCDNFFLNDDGVPD